MGLARKIIKGEALATMTEMEAESVDMLLTDPPYFMPATHYVSRQAWKKTFADMGIFEYYFAQYFTQAHRILKADGVVYMFCNAESYPIFYWHAYRAFQKVEMLVWDKQTIGLGSPWRRQHELILFAYKSKCDYGGNQADIIRCKRVAAAHRVHPAQKPVELLKVLIGKHARKPIVVCDTFAGSGSTVEACRHFDNVGWIAIENDENYFETMVKKFNEDAIQRELLPHK